MSKELEVLKCLERIDNTLCLNNIKGKLEFGIDTEEHTDCDSVIGMAEDLDTIKQALLKAQANARSEEILQKYYQEGITLDSVRALKQERDNYKKILEIIKERHIDILSLEECIEREKMGNVASALEYYNENYAFNRSCELTQEEFDLLKRWLE